MCVTFLCTDGLERGLGYKLILLNNRDEVLDRRTSGAHWEGGFLGGRDEQAPERGTWLGVSRQGRVGNLLSITEPQHVQDRLIDPPSRGVIPSDFLASGLTAGEFCDRLHKNAHLYQGFQFVTLERNAADRFEVLSLTNKMVDEVKPRSWPPGSYCIGNSPRDRMMKKVEYGEREFSRLIAEFTPQSSEAEIVAGLMRLAKDDTQHFPDPQIGLQTHRNDDYNRCLSSIFVRFPPAIRYGTRSHTILLVDANNRAFFREERMVEVPEDPADARWEVLEHRFELE
ncbi:hypothetical protein M3Y99_01347000 [Aphelenchoides fujianensis]|nr:hypothetical protein M3Y99_01347000 [Aphelenchoides fujianensis]